MVNKHLNPDGLDYKLFTPGPVEVPEFLLEVMKLPNDTHRSMAYREMHKSIKENTQKMLSTKSDILVFASSGTGFMEACVRNLLKDDETGLFLSCGAFGDRWYQVAVANGKKGDKVEVEWGTGFSAEFVKEKLAEKSYPIVFIQLNETSTGVKNPLAEIGPIVEEHGALLCVDSVSGMGGTLMKVDEWNIDVALASVQKCFGVPPGVGIAAVSDDAFAKAKEVKNRGFYFDFLTIKKSGDKNEYPTTPPIPQLRTLKVALDKVIEIGAENFAQQHENRCNLIQDWAKDLKFKIFSKEGFHSQTVVTVENTPESPLKGNPELTQKFVDNLWENGYRIVNGYKSLKGKTFRIAPMGWVTEEETKKMLEVATKTLNEL